MARFSVNFLQSALNDLDEIILYMASYSKEAAINWHDKLIAIANKLEAFPFMGVAVPDSKLAALEFRMISLGNYIVFYRVYNDAEEITILRVWDARRDYPRFFKKYIEQNKE